MPVLTSPALPTTAIGRAPGRQVLGDEGAQLAQVGAALGIQVQDPDAGPADAQHAHGPRHHVVRLRAGIDARGRQASMPVGCRVDADPLAGVLASRAEAHQVGRGAARREGAHERRPGSPAAR